MLCCGLGVGAVFACLYSLDNVLERVVVASDPRTHLWLTCDGDQASGRRLIPSTLMLCGVICMNWWVNQLLSQRVKSHLLCFRPIKRCIFSFDHDVLAFLVVQCPTRRSFNGLSRDSQISISSSFRV